MDTKTKTYQVVYAYIVDQTTMTYVRDRRIVDAVSPQAAVADITNRMNSLPDFEVFNVLEIAKGWAVRGGKVVGDE